MLYRGTWEILENKITDQIAWRFIEKGVRVSGNPRIVGFIRWLEISPVGLS